MSCQVYTQCFILEPVPVSHVVPSIHPVFYTGTSACIPCRAKYTPGVLYWNQCLYPMSCQVYTQCFILEPVPVSHVVPSIHPVFYTGISACILCRAKHTLSVLYWNQCLCPMSCQVYTQCFILEPVPVIYVVPSIHPVFYTGTSACVPCHAKYTPSVLYWNQCLCPMSCQVYTQCFILEPVPVSYVVPSIHPVFFLLEPVPVIYVVPSIHPVFYTGTSALNHTRKFTDAADKYNLSHVTRKSVFGACDQVRLKPACSAAEASKSLEILTIKSISIILSRQRITKTLIRPLGCTG